MAKPPLKVIILEPCPDTLESMAALITIWGHEARGTNTARKAVQLYHDFRPDVMFVNVDSSDMNCLDFVRAICTEPASRLPLMTAISTRGDTPYRVPAVEMGFDCQLTKPVDPQFLKDLLAYYAQTLDRAAKKSEDIESDEPVTR